MKYYNDLAQGYEELYKEEQFKKIEIIKQYIPFHEKWFVLDVGCGPYFADLKGTVMGIDPAAKLLKIAKKKIPVVQAKGEFLPFKNNTFMAVVSITALQNFDDVEKGLLEMKRVAKEYIAISVLKKSAKMRMIEEIIPKLLKVEKIVEEEKDIIFFCRKQR